MVQLLPSQAHHKVETGGCEGICARPALQHSFCSVHARYKRLGLPKSSNASICGVQCASTDYNKYGFHGTRLPNSNSRDLPLRLAGTHTKAPLSRGT